jgi:hypothetical protein
MQQSIGIGVAIEPGGVRNVNTTEYQLSAWNQAVDIVTVAYTYYG